MSQPHVPRRTITPAPSVPLQPRPAEILPHRERPALGLPVAMLLAPIVLTFVGTPALADATTDCFADRVAAYRVGTVSAPPATNSWQPGIVLGPPGDATPSTGSLSVMSLGHGGQIVLEFVDNVVVDGPGPDFILFENPFFCSAVPLSSSDSWSVNAEPGIVEVSEAGCSPTMRRRSRRWSTSAATRAWYSGSEALWG